MGVQWTIITLHILTSSIQDTSENYGLRLLAQFYAWCSRVFQRSRTNKRLDIGKDTDRFIMRNSLIWLWRLRSPRSAISKWETLESRWCGFIPSLEAWEPREPQVWVPVQGQEKMNVLAQQAKRVISPFFSLFVPSRPSKDVGDAHPHQGRPHVSLSLLIQMLISSRNTLTDTPRNNV